MTLWSLSWIVAVVDLAGVDPAHVAVERELLRAVPLDDAVRDETRHEHHDDGEEDAATQLGHDSSGGGVSPHRLANGPDPSAGDD